MVIGSVSVFRFKSRFRACEEGALIQKGKGNSGINDGCGSTKVSMDRKTFSLPLKEISHHTGIFSGRFPILTADFRTMPKFFDHIPIPMSDCVHHVFRFSHHLFYSRLFFSVYLLHLYFSYLIVSGKIV